MKLSKRLIINADGYGLCREVNEAVEQIAAAAARTGVILLGGVSVLANGACWESAAGFLCAHPELSAGVHLSLVEGSPVAPASEVRALTGANGYFIGFSALFKRWVLHPLAVSHAVEIECRAQIERLIRARVELTHVDSQQHLHAFPPVYRCAVRVCQKYGIPALRLPLKNRCTSLRLAGSIALQLSLPVARTVSPRTGLHHNNHFRGFRRVGAYGLPELISDLQTIPVGLTEIALHPSLDDGSPYCYFLGDRTRQALLDERFLREIAYQGIELTSWEKVTR